MCKELFILSFFIFQFVCLPTMDAQKKSHPDKLRQIIYKSTNDSIRGHNYLKIAEYFMRRDLDQAALHIDSAKAIKPFVQSPIGTGLIKMTSGKLWLFKKDNEKSLTMLHEAKEQFEQLGNIELVRYVCYELGTVYLAKGEHLKANEFLLLSRQYAEQLNDRMNIAHAVSGLGVIQHKLGNIDDAYAYYQEALPIYQERKFTNGQSTILLNLAVIDKQRKNYDSAIDLYHQALRINNNEKKPNTNLLASIYGNLSSLYVDKKNYKLALEYGKKSLPLREKTATNAELANSYLLLAQTNIKLGNLTEALQFIDKAKSNADGNIELLYQITSTESNIFAAQKNYSASLTALNKSNMYKDSLYNVEKNKQINELNIQYETKKKENEILKLELIEQQNKSKITNQYLAIGSLILILGLLGFFLYKNILQKRKIENQNSIIAAALSEKDTLLREIHHRVKNNLQVISSLLFIQSASLKDEKAKEAIQQSRSRVHSMSLIHQDLYKDENLTGIDMASYLSKLSTDLVETYSLHTGKIDVDITSDEMILDVETVVPIGLIVNELITNSLKYAFPQNEDGVIKVQLHQTPDGLKLLVADNGIGLTKREANERTGYGHSLINAFLKKLDATMDIDGQAGTVITILIKNFKKLN